MRTQLLFATGWADCRIGTGAAYLTLSGGVWVVTQAEFDRRLALGQARLASEADAARDGRIARFEALQAKYRAPLGEPTRRRATVHLFVPRDSDALASERLAA